MKLKTNLKIKVNIIDPVPFMNVVILLVMFFVLATQFIGEPGVVVSLPEIDNPFLFSVNSTIVTLKDGKIFLLDEEVDMDQLKEKLMNRKPELLAIKPDSSVSNSRVSEIIVLSKKIGINKIAIAADK